MVLSLTLHKGMTKRVVRDLCIPTPDFDVVETDSDVEVIDLPFPLFAKPVAEGTGKGISGSSRIGAWKDLVSLCGRLLGEFGQPVLVETFLPGREFTVGITGTGSEAVSLGVIEVVLRKDAESHAYSYVNKQRFEELVEYRLVKDPTAEKAAQRSPWPRTVPWDAGMRPAWTCGPMPRVCAELPGDQPPGRAPP